MAVDADQSYPSVALRRVLRLLENLNETHNGSTLYQHIERSFHDLESIQLKTERYYIELLELLFDALIRQLDKHSPLQTRAHILRANLVPPMQPHELRLLQRETKRLLANILVQQHGGDGAQERAFDPLLSPIYASTSTADQMAAEYSLEEAGLPFKTAETDDVLAPPPGSFNRPLQEGSTNILNIKTKLSEQITRATEYNTELSLLIKESMEAVRLVDGKQNLDEMRITHLRRYIKLFKEHQELTTKFSAIHQQLNEVETESQQLDDELNRARMLSMTDELTQLPNRRALMQRLQDEVTRVQRYSSPLALAMIDLDEFKPINDNFGHDAGDAVLRYFAETALAVCRHHDIVSRYGGEEFALLMPNTELEGALCALRKIQNEMSGSLCRVDDGVEVRVPTFSAGVALYNPGEDPEELIKRADTAMYRAKRSGRNRIEIHTMGTRQQKLCPK